LQGGHEPIQAKGNDSGTDKDQAAVFADALPDQPGAADLGQGARANSRMERSMIMASPYRRLTPPSSTLTDVDA
jgi:hypothetical protein